MEAEAISDILFVCGDVNSEPLAHFWGGGGPSDFVKEYKSTHSRVYDTNYTIPCSKEGDCCLYYPQQSLMIILTNTASYSALDTELNVIPGDSHHPDMLWG